MIKLLRGIILSGLYLSKTAILPNKIVHAQCTNIENEGESQSKHNLTIYCTNSFDTIIAV